MARPALFPRQLIVMVSDALADRVEAAAEARPDKSKSAAHRRLLELGIILADAIESGAYDGSMADLFDTAKAVQ